VPTEDTRSLPAYFFVSVPCARLSWPFVKMRVNPWASRTHPSIAEALTALPLTPSWCVGWGSLTLHQGWHAQKGQL